MYQVTTPCKQLDGWKQNLISRTDFICCIRVNTYFKNVSQQSVVCGFFIKMWQSVFTLVINKVPKDLVMISSTLGFSIL